ncbi:MAG: DUF4905 domain-containing protein [Ignavibacteria bacterium]|nr:DUF4905 domain-containing protein [Ignavibacteria bacterium]
MFEFLRKGELRPIWRYSTKGVIWRVLPSADGKLVGEERDLARKEATFFCLNQMTGEVLWEGISFGEPWWTGIEVIHRETIFLHGFAKPDLPGHKIIIAVDLLTGSTLWRNEELRFEHALGESVFASKEGIEGRLVFELDHRSGGVLRSWGNNEQVIRDAKVRSVDMVDSDIEFPVSMDELLLGDSDIASAIQKHRDTKATIGPVEIIDNDDVAIFNYYEKVDNGTEDNPRLNSVLKVLDKERGKVIFSEILNQNVPAVVPNSFFVQRGLLFYVKERSQLIAVRLPSHSGA